MASRDALDQAERRMSRVDRVDARTTDQPPRTCPFKKSYNGHDFTRSNASEALDRDPTGAVLMCFITHIAKIKSGAFIQDWKVEIKS